MSKGIRAVVFRSSGQLIDPYALIGQIITSGLPGYIIFDGGRNKMPVNTRIVTTLYLPNLLFYLESGPNLLTLRHRSHGCGCILLKQVIKQSSVNFANSSPYITLSNQHGYWWLLLSSQHKTIRFEWFNIRNTSLKCWFKIH